MNRRRILVRGLGVGLLLSLLTATLLPAQKVSGIGLVIGGLLVWSEFALVSATIIVSEWSPTRPTSPVVAAMRRNLVLIVIAIPILGWIVMLPFTHVVGSELAIFVACLAIVLGFGVAGRRSPDDAPTVTPSRFRARAGSVRETRRVGPQRRHKCRSASLGGVVFRIEDHGHGLLPSVPLSRVVRHAVGLHSCPAE